MDNSQYMHSSHRVPSRRAKTEGQKMVKQTIWLILIAGVLVAVFLFGILPAVIRFASRGGDLGTPNQDTLPPQMPLISAPVSATHSATLALTGFGERQSEVVALQNGSEVKRTTITNENGEFTLEVPLAEGQNSLTFYAVDGAGNESSVTKAYLVALDNKAPTIELESPTNGQQVESRKNQNITIKGKTEADAKIYINGRLVRADKDGVFTSTLMLQEGENKIVFKAEDAAGNTAEQEITVNFKI